MWRRQKPLSEEEAYIQKLNEEAKERELHPPTHLNFDFGRLTRNSAIRADRIQAGTISASHIQANHLKPSEMFMSRLRPTARAEVGDIWVHPDTNETRRWNGQSWDLVKAIIK